MKHYCPAPRPFVQESARARRDARQVAHRAAAQVVGGREHPRKNLIAPVHDAGRRAEIAQQLQGLEPQRAEAAIAHRGEASHLGIAKAVDGLHGITDHEQCASVALRPVQGQRAQQVVLLARGVLELVHQDVHEARAESFGQRRRGALLAERAARGAGYFRVIALAVCGELQRELLRREQQQSRQCVERAPRILRHARIRQLADGRERG